MSSAPRRPLLTGLLLVLSGAVRVGAPLAVVWGLMYESWSPVAAWLIAGLLVELLVWLDGSALRARTRGPERR